MFSYLYVAVTSLCSLCFCVEYFSVLNEFILKNPTLESKKDQRELQVTETSSLIPSCFSFNVTEMCQLLKKNT